MDIKDKQARIRLFLQLIESFKAALREPVIVDEDDW